MMRFRKAESEDALKIINLVNSAYRGEYAKQGWTTEAYILDGQRVDLELVTQMITGDASEVIVAVDESQQVIGCINLRFESSALYFGMLTVEPKLQNQGIAKKLLVHIEEIALKKGLNTIRMTVIKGRTELSAYYERFGYKKTGNVEAFPEDPRYGIPKGEKPVLEEYKKILVGD